MTQKAVRVLIVDDSATARHALRLALEEPHSGLEVVGQVASASETLAAIRKLEPDIVTLDVHLAAEDGVALARFIMETRPTPILLVTGVDPKSPTLAFRALQAGALDVLPKLPAPSDPQYPYERQRLVRTLDALSRVPLVTRRPPRPNRAETGRRVAPRVEGLVIGASTGGPPALQRLLAELPRPFPVPICIAQHIVDGFVEQMGEWLALTTGHPVVVCDRSMAATPGTVYLAPAGAHLAFVARGHIDAIPVAPKDLHRPSVDVLFESAAEHLGNAAIGLVMTGMGRDGAHGVTELKAHGAITLVQEPATCVADSMPTSAIATGGIDFVIAPARLPAVLAAFVTRGCQIRQAGRSS